VAPPRAMKAQRERLQKVLFPSTRITANLREGCGRRLDVCVRALAQKDRRIW